MRNAAQPCKRPYFIRKISHGSSCLKLGCECSRIERLYSIATEISTTTSLDQQNQLILDCMTFPRLLFSTAVAALTACTALEANAVSRARNFGQRSGPPVRLHRSNLRALESQKVIFLAESYHAVAYLVVFVGHRPHIHSSHRACDGLTFF